jgi:hypothetical protein
MKDQKASYHVVLQPAFSSRILTQSMLYTSANPIRAKTAIRQKTKAPKTPKTPDTPKL